MNIFDQNQVLKNTDRELTAVQKQEKNESGAVSKRAKEVLLRPPKAERPYKEKPPAKENNRSKPKPPANEKLRSTASTESTDPKVGLKDEAKSASINKRADVDQEPETTSRSTSGSSNPVQPLASEKKTETERSSKRQTDRESEKEKKEKIRNKDRPTIQIYRPGAKRIITTKSSVS